MLCAVNGSGQQNSLHIKDQATISDVFIPNNKSALRIDVFLKYAMLMLPFMKIDEKDFSETVLLTITSHTAFCNSIIDWEDQSSLEFFKSRLVTFSEIYGAIILINSGHGQPHFVENREYNLL